MTYIYLELFIIVNLGLQLRLIMIINKCYSINEIMYGTSAIVTISSAFILHFMNSSVDHYTISLV